MRLELFGDQILVEPCNEEQQVIVARKTSAGIVRNAGRDSIAKVGDTVYYTGENHPTVEGLTLLTEYRTGIIIECKND